MPAKLTDEQWQNLIYCIENIDTILNFDRVEVNSVVSWSLFNGAPYCPLPNGKVEIVKDWKIWHKDLPLVCHTKEEAYNASKILAQNKIFDGLDDYVREAWQNENRVAKMIAGDICYYGRLWEDDWGGKDIQIRANDGDDFYFYKSFKTQEERTAFWKVIEDNAPFCWESRKLLGFEPE